MPAKTVEIKCKDKFANIIWKKLKKKKKKHAKSRWRPESKRKYDVRVKIIVPWVIRTMEEFKLEQHEGSKLSNFLKKRISWNGFCRVKRTSLQINVKNKWKCTQEPYCYQWERLHKILVISGEKKKNKDTEEINKDINKIRSI